MDLFNFHDADSLIELGGSPLDRVTLHAMRSRKTLAVLALALLCAGAGTATYAIQQAPATFRAGVDLVVVDVVVIDKRGAPVPDLVAADFSVTAGSRPRRIVSIEFVGVKRSGATPEVSVPKDLPAPSSNERIAPAGRSILFVVDVDEIRAGEGRLAMRTIADHVETLDPSDRVGIVTLPYGSPRVDFTTNRQLIREASGQIVGASRRVNESAMTPGEAAMIALGDTSAVQAYHDRARGLRSGIGIQGIIGGCDPPPTAIVEAPTVAPTVCKERAERTLDVYRRGSRATLDTLRALAEAMEPLAGQKALVLVSEGFYADAQLQRDIRAFAFAAERARVALYALHLDAPLMEAGTAGGPTAASRILDDRIGFDGMADLAYAARGTAQRVIAHPAAPLKRIDDELSGYYLLAFERSADDGDGEHIRIDVKVNRPDLDVRSRREFTPVARNAPAAATKKAAADPKVAMGTLLNLPAALADIAIDVDTFTSPIDAKSSKVSVMIAADMATGGRSVNVGFEVRDASGKAVADEFDPNADVRPLGGGRALYPVTVALAPGSYTVTVGVIDTDGKRGSVSHAFTAPAWPAGLLRMSGVLIGEVSGGAFRPIARLGTDRSAVAVRVEAHATSPRVFESISMRLEITRVGETTAVLNAPGRLAGPADALRRAATNLLDLRDLPAGDYIIRVTLESDAGKVAAQASRLLTIRP